MEGRIRACGEGPFCYDAPVYISGLETHSWLNDRGARVCAQHPRADGRINIQMLCTPDMRVWIKPQNLTVITFADELKAPKYAGMSDVERTDMGMYIYSSEGATPVPGVNAVLMSTTTNDRILTPHEKSELLRVGQWGGRTSPMAWGDLVRAIKRDRNGVYPRDWHAQVITGKLFEDAGQPTSSGMSMLNPYTDLASVGTVRL